MHLLIYCNFFLFFKTIINVTAAALPLIDNGLGAQGDEFGNADVTTSPIPLPASSTRVPQASITAPIPQENRTDSQTIAAAQAVADSAFEMLSTNISTTQINTTHSAVQNNLDMQAVKLVTDLSTPNNSTNSTESQPTPASTAPAAGQMNGLMLQHDAGDNGLLAQGDGTGGIDFGPSRQSSPTPFPPTPVTGSSTPALAPSSPSSSLPSSLAAPSSIIPPSAASPSSNSIIDPPIPTAPVPSITAAATTTTPPQKTSNPTPPYPQDNGLQAQDSGSENIDHDPASNTTSTNHPHEMHNADGTLMVASVQDVGLQAQDAGGANVVWAPGEAYGGGMGGEVNVPVVVDGGSVAED